MIVEFDETEAKAINNLVDSYYELNKEGIPKEVIRRLVVETYLEHNDPMSSMIAMEEKLSNLTK